MSIAEQDIEIGHAPEEIPTDRVELDRWLDWKLRRIKQLRGEQAHNNAVVAEEIEKLASWAAEQNATLQKSIEWFEGQVAQAAAGYDFGAKKSRTLPHGKFGRKITTRAGIRIIDKLAALAFAKVHGIPTKEEVQVSALKEYEQSTGTVPNGCERVEEVETFYVEVAP